ncbi:tyrosine-type recombinase/integrase [Olsenella intestinalis]|uniref:tyrosine-type recombinase/integrase n=1 Tax=Olsenella intestinalis TaxID=2930083 RepID=UPI00200BDB68|nr:site-specific integrase [Olsenella intestinalis]
MPRKGLQPGQNNISNCTAHDHGKTPGKRGHTWSLQWHANVDGVTKRHMTKVTDATRAEVYAAANRRFAELMALSRLPGDGTWDQFKPMDAFVRDVCIPTVRENNYGRKLRDRTVDAYVRCLTRYAEQVEGLRIADAIVPASLERCFKSIAVSSGNPTAKQTAKVVSRYVMGLLVKNRVIEFNPMRQYSVETTVDEVRDVDVADERTLLPAERKRVVEHLLSLDPSSPARKRWTAEQMTAKRSNVIDMTLVQATCGLRISEVRQLTRASVKDDGRRLTLTVSPSASKTHKGRVVPVMDLRVADRIIERLNRLPGDPDTLLFPSPVSNTVWDARNVSKAMRSFYDELSEDLGIPLLARVSTHVWRRVLNSEWANLGVPVERRAAYFGQSSEVNTRYYTDLVDLDPLEALVKDRM